MMKLCRVSFNHTRITIGQCDSSEQFSLLQCSTSLLASECNSDMVGWVECSLSGELINLLYYICMHLHSPTFKSFVYSNLNFLVY